MQVQYRNNREDFEVWFEWSQRAAKKNNYDAYLFWLGWGAAMCGLGFYVSFQSEHIFAACVFLVCAVVFLKQNWSFAQRWKGIASAYALSCDEYTATLSLEPEGLTERFLGLSQFVPWDQVRSYVEFNGKLFIRFLKSRALIVPTTDLKDAEKASLMEVLRSHGVREET